MLQVQNNYQRAYRLVELLQEKYGRTDDRIEFGLQILAQWCSGSNALKIYTYDLLQDYLLTPKEKDTPAFTPALAEGLRQFFGLKTTDQLYNNAAL